MLSTTRINQDIKTTPKNLAVMNGSSGIIGLFCGLLVATDFKLSLLAGYTGTDLIEGIYKIRRKQKITI